MKVYVDKTRCQGHARCLLVAEGAFDLDDLGFGYVRDGLNLVDPLTIAAIREGAANCPERAIIMES
ncbi:MAG TPA: ferredoxin [Acidimicrobiales bacterium]|jgi:ferredoxin|nr:ferredoxin [Acidimicrobiales bacterium]